jgi:trigger factor
LKIEQKYLEDHQLEVIVETDQESFQKAKHLAAKHLAKGKKIPGYRPGKAPYQLIVNHFGEAAVIDHALEHYLDEIYPQIIEEVEKEPYGPGQVKEIKSLEPPVFIFNIPLQPEVELANYLDLRLPFEKSSINDEDVDQVLERMRSQHSSVEPVDHPAEEGNLVDTSLDCREIDSDPDDEDSYLLKNQPLPVMIKAKDEDDSKEWPFPGFSRQLLGVSGDEQLELTYQFPEDDSVDEDYQGKEMLYSVSIRGIRERTLPELDEDFVALVSDLKSVSELRDEIENDLLAQKEMEDDNNYLNSIIEAILEDAEIKYPPQMVENEIEGEVKDLEARLMAQGMDLEMYLNIQNLDEEKLRDEIKPSAESRIRQGLVIGKISESENFDINPDEITSEYQALLDEHFGDDEKARSEYLKSGESVALLNRVSSQYITRKTLDFLKAVAQGEDYSSFIKVDEEQTDDQEQDEIAPDQESKSEPDPEPSEHEDSDQAEE